MQDRLGDKVRLLHIVRCKRDRNYIDGVDLDHFVKTYDVQC
jgi:hypothetical protein